MIKYFVRTTGERSFDYSPLNVTPLYDYNHDPINSFISQLEIISEYDAVLLEDDLVLCKDFQNEIEKVIAKYSDKIINFFSRPKYYFQTTLTLEDFTYNQCTYYPKGIGKILAEEMKKILKWWPSSARLWSQVESRALMNLGIPHIIYRPCLVQHNDHSSILQPGKEARTTIWFKNYLDELNLDYNNLDVLKYRKELSKLRDKYFKEEVNKDVNR